MIKRVIVLILVVVICLVPSVSLANDAIGYEDFNENLSVSYKLNTNEIEVGGEINFILTLTNNTKDTIGEIYITDLFSNANISNYYDKHLETNAFGNLDIEPGEKVVLDITADVSENIYWYIDKDEYYTVFQPVVEYTSFTEDEDYDDYYFQVSKPTVVRITNLKNGSEFIKLESYENQLWVFSEARSHHYDGYWFDDGIYMGTYVESRYSIKNLSDLHIENINIRIDYFGSILIEQLNSGELIEDDIVSYALTEKALEKNELEIKTQAIFKIDGDYYCVQLSKKQPIQKKFFPAFEGLLNRDFVKDKYILSIKNSTGIDYQQFYFDIVYGGEYSYDLDNLYTFENNQTFFTSIPDMKGISYFVLGYVENDILYTWLVDYIYGTEINETKLDQVFSMEYFNIFEEEPIPTPTLSPSPSRTPMPKPTPLPVNTPEPKPTIKPSPTHATTPKPSPRVTVNSVKVIPAVPVWVWIALGCALLATGVLSVLLYVRRSRK